jgi:transposase, IS5 family
MERQRSFAQAEYARKKKTTRRERFLNEMERVVPWVRLVACIEPHYFKGERGRKPVGIERMLRMYFLQQWYALADEALEDALYDSQAMRSFVGIDLNVESVPDATTLLKFRRILERHALTQKILDEVNAHLASHHLLMREGTIVDATIIAAPSSTKNQEGKRDSEMHQVKKGNQWHFGMKAHVGADAESGLIHTVICTPANVADIQCASGLLHGEEKVAYGDAGYTGIEKREEKSGQAGGRTWEVAIKRGKIKRMAEGQIKDLTQQIERLKAQVRAKVEHAFHVVKNLFGYRKVRYRGLKKNTAQLHTLFALANLVLAKGKLLAQTHAQ